MKTYSRINKLQLESTNLPTQLLKSCRLCLTPVLDNAPFDLLTLNKTLIQTKIKFCVGLDISEDDGLPSRLCEKCNTTVINFCSFKNMCLSNQLKLQKYSRTPNASLLEPNLQSDEQLHKNIVETLNALDGKDVISLVDEKSNTISLLLEEEYIHPDAPEKVILQIKNKLEESKTSSKRPLTEDEADTLRAEQVVPIVHRFRESLPRFYTCRTCKQNFTRADRLINHEKQVHNIIRLHCGVCAKSFLNKSLLERHIRTHNDKPFCCTICSKRFSQKLSINRHYARLHCDQRYECSKCPRVFATRDALKSHFFTQHTERSSEELNRYKCKHCTKSFCHSSGLSRHLHTHTGVIFTCKQCPKGFSDASCLRRHSLFVHDQQDVEATNHRNQTNSNATVVHIKIG